MSNDRDYESWLNAYKKHFFNFWWTYYLIKTKDTYFLTNEKPMDYENEEYENNYPNGFIEKDFQFVLKNENPKDKRIKNKIVLYILNNVDLSKIQKNLGDRFQDVIEMALIHGDYEKYGILFEKVISKVIDKKYIQKESLIEIALFRGTVLGSRDESKLQNFKSKILNVICFK